MTGISLLKRHFFISFLWPAINILVAVWSCYLLCKIGNLIFWRASHSSILEDNLNDSWQDFISLKLTVLIGKEPEVVHLRESNSLACYIEALLVTEAGGRGGEWGLQSSPDTSDSHTYLHFSHHQQHIAVSRRSLFTSHGQDTLDIILGHSLPHNHNRTYFYAGVSREMRVQCNV